MSKEMIYRDDAIDAAKDWYNGLICGSFRGLEKRLKSLPPAQPEQTRIFVELVVEYPDPELCTYKEYRGKPYYSIKYIENGETYVGYGTYKPEVLSRYLQEYFISSAQPEIIRCKDCRWGKEVCGNIECFADTNVPPEYHGYEWFCPNGERKTDG